MPNVECRRKKRRFHAKDAKGIQAKRKERKGFLNRVIVSTPLKPSFATRMIRLS